MGIQHFAIGNHAGQACVTQVSSDLSHIAKADLLRGYIVSADSQLITHIRSACIHAHNPVNYVATRFYGFADIAPLDAIAVAAQAKVPTPGVYPRNIAPEARKTWDQVVRSQRFRRAIQGREMIPMWAIAARYLKAACDNAGIHPYKDEHNSQFDLQNMLDNRMGLVKSRVEQIYRSLSRDRIVQSQGVWKWRAVESDKKMFYVVAVKSIKLNPATEKNLRSILSKYEGYNGEDLHYSVTPDSAVYVDVLPGKHAADIEMHVGIPRGLVLKYIHVKKVSSPEEEARILALLKAGVQAWSHRKLHEAVATASAEEQFTAYMQRQEARRELRLPFLDFYENFIAASDFDPGRRVAYDFWKNNRAHVVAAATKQLRALAPIDVHNLDDIGDDDAKAVELPKDTVLLPRHNSDGDPETFYVVLYPDAFYNRRVVLDEDARNQCADIENEAQTFDGGIAAAFELLVEELPRLMTLEYTADRVVKSLGPIDTWPYATSRNWLHHLNLRSTHPGLTFDVVSTPYGKHLAAIYSGAW